MSSRKIKIKENRGKWRKAAPFALAKSPIVFGMAISSISEALAQYATACAGEGWQASTATAQSALEAIRYLVVQRAQDIEDQGSKLTYESIKEEKAILESFLGVKRPKAGGRFRRVGVGFSGGGIQ